MKAHVICCNDSVEFVVVNDLELAELKLIELRTEYYAQNKHAFVDFEEYTIRCYWHIHTVKAI